MTTWWQRRRCNHLTPPHPTPPRPSPEPPHRRGLPAALPHSPSLRSAPLSPPLAVPPFFHPSAPRLHPLRRGFWRATGERSQRSTQSGMSAVARRGGGRAQRCSGCIRLPFGVHEDRLRCAPTPKCVRMCAPSAKLPPVTATLVTLIIATRSCTRSSCSRHARSASAQMASALISVCFLCFAQSPRMRLGFNDVAGETSQTDEQGRNIVRC